jgi:hypothetical protein
LGVAESDPRAGPRFNVEVKDVLDWLVAADDGANGKSCGTSGVWVVTSAARYRLLRAAPAYADTFSGTRRRAAADGRDAWAAKAADAALAAAGVDASTLGTPAARHGTAACRTCLGPAVRSVVEFRLPQCCLRKFAGTEVHPARQVEMLQKQMEAPTTGASVKLLTAQVTIKSRLR